MKVAVLTTSYPSGPEDPAGRFVADAVDGVRARGVAIRAEVGTQEEPPHVLYAGGLPVVFARRR
ncbi:MAG: hypothetical protein ABSB24_19685 [Gaiellaceae bacterium]